MKPELVLESVDVDLSTQTLVELGYGQLYSPLLMMKVIKLLRRGAS
jgi:hypothetical protein